MKLTYWKAQCLTDADCYSIRAKTRKEVKAELEGRHPEDFDAPEKITIEYNNAFDLMLLCTMEGSKA